MNILVNEQVRLTEFRSSDKPALIEHLREKEIYDRTLRIPYMNSPGADVLGPT